ncbi:MAG: FAD-dependent oxidoreductase [Betaproteobacteria bacterium]|nr:FAD-dependent oxidoreductase [Betaproteobacteria bacterium]
MKADVVVVGGGGSGLAAAIEAAASGADVVLFEKNLAPGGTTARSIGSITATRTPHQLRLGIVDSPDEHYRDMELFAKHESRPDNDVLRRILTENVPETLRWLCSLGVEFFGPVEEPPHKKPRMHNVLPNSRAYIFHLERAARRRGVRILTSSRARRLLVREGSVAGVEFDQPDRPGQVIHASGGVVLAAGDYAADPEFKRALISDAVARTEPINPTATGDGQRMAIEVGAHIINGDMFTTVLVPAHEIFDAGAILVNKDGERFADETKAMVFELAYQPDGVAYIVFDGVLAGKFSRWPDYISTAPGFAYAYLSDYEKNRPDLVHKADTLGKLAALIGADPARLATAVERYNASGGTGTGASDALARRGRPEIRTSPYYALGPVKNYINYTDGGLAVNERLEVLDSQNRPIPGLYAAGSTGQGGLLLKGHGHHLGWAFTSGRLAGRNAAMRGRG